MELSNLINKKNKNNFDYIYLEIIKIICKRNQQIKNSIFKIKYYGDNIFIKKIDIDYNSKKILVIFDVWSPLGSYYQDETISFAELKI